MQPQKIRFALKMSAVDRFLATTCVRGISD